MHTPPHLIGLCAPAGTGKDAVGAYAIQQALGPEHVASIAFADPLKRILMRGFGLTPAHMWDPRCKDVPLLMPAHRMLDAWTPLRQALAEELGEHLSRVHEEELAIWLADQADRWTRNRTPRDLQKTFGTEFGRRRMGEDIWVNHTILTSALISNAEQYSPVLGVMAGEGPPLKAVVISGVRFPNEINAIRRARGEVWRLVRRSVEDVDAPNHESETALRSIPFSEFNYVLDLAEGLDRAREMLRPMVQGILQAR